VSTLNQANDLAMSYYITGTNKMITDDHTHNKSS